MLKAISFLLVLATAAFAQDSAKEEAQVWNLEKAYWEYVKGNDSGEVSRAMARGFRWLAICQLSARPERSHH